MIVVVITIYVVNVHLYFMHRNKAAFSALRFI